MSHLARICTIITTSIVITACGPIYNTEYAYIPPKSNIGKMCITQCQQSKMMCEQLNATRRDACLAKAKQDALYEYQIYKLQREKENKPVKKSPRNFEKTWGCNQTSNCDASFRTCYETCGGEVLERQVCTAFCDK